ncbi:reverse transcriptase [Pyricularia oryzae]|nr:reverse transcriptase [Pyricularia oryzae]
MRGLLGHLRSRGMVQPTARAILPAYKTTPSSTVLRDAGLPSARVALAHTRLKYGARLRLADKGHPLVSRLRETPRARNPGQPATTLQMAAQLLPRIRRLELRAPRNAPDSPTDPTGGVPKEEAARRFIEWLDMVSPGDIVVYTDGSEKHENNCVQIGYGWAVFRAGLEFAAGSASITPESHVFDAEAIGALKGLQAAARAQPGARIWICVDSTSVIWGLRGDAPHSSRWAFLEFHNLVDLLRKHGSEVRVRWCPGHQGIPGNDRADELAKAGSAGPPDPDRGLSKPHIAVQARSSEPFFRI